VREGHRTQQGLEVKAVRDLDHAGEVVREPERGARRRRQEQRKAARLVAPEVVVVDEVGELVVDCRNVGSRRTCPPELFGGLAGKILQLDARRLTT
jgi:hypothetical protein